MLKVILSYSEVGKGSPKVEWIDAEWWEVWDDRLHCYAKPEEVTEEVSQIKIAEFAKGEWIGVKRADTSSKEEALADELTNDPRVKEIMAKHLIKKLEIK